MNLRYLLAFAQFRKFFGLVCPQCKPTPQGVKNYDLIIYAYGGLVGEHEGELRARRIEPTDWIEFNWNE